MARRSSYIQNEITHCLTEMRERVNYTHLEQTGFNPNTVAMGLIKPMRAGLKQWKDSTPQDMRARISLSQDSSFVAVVPLPARWASPHSRLHYRRNILEDGYSFLKWADYRDRVYVNGPSEEESSGHMRGLAFTITYEKAIIPTRWPVTPQFNTVIDEPDDGILLTPERMGEVWETALPRLTKLHDLYVLTEYCYEFGRVATKHCTTEGITKRVWPEVANFMASSRGKVIEDSKMSGWPIDLRRRLLDLKADKKEDNNGVTSAYLKGQLHRIGDMVLTSKLMLSGKEYVAGLNQDTEFTVNYVDLTAVNIKTEYLRDIAPSLFV